MTTEAAEAGVRSDGCESCGCRGTVIIEWPGPGRHGVSAIAGHAITIRDAFSGGELQGELITTVTSADIVIHASAESLVTADLTMFADEDGNPVFTGKPHFRDGEVITATFPFIVAEMRVRQ